MCTHRAGFFGVSPSPRAHRGAGPPCTRTQSRTAAGWSTTTGCPARRGARAVAREMRPRDCPAPRSELALQSVNSQTTARGLALCGGPRWSTRGNQRAGRRGTHQDVDLCDGDRRHGARRKGRIQTTQAGGGKERRSHRATPPPRTAPTSASARVTGPRCVQATVGAQGRLGRAANHAFLRRQGTLAPGNATSAAGPSSRASCATHSFVARTLDGPRACVCLSGGVGTTAYSRPHTPHARRPMIVRVRTRCVQRRALFDPGERDWHLRVSLTRRPRRRRGTQGRHGEGDAGRWGHCRGAAGAARAAVQGAGR